MGRALRLHEAGTGRAGLTPENSNRAHTGWRSPNGQRRPPTQAPSNPTSTRGVCPRCRGSSRFCPSVSIPAAPPEYGEYLVQEALETIVSNPDVWAKTVLFVTYDENGGFLDPVAPPTAPDRYPWRISHCLELAQGWPGGRGPMARAFAYPPRSSPSFSARHICLLGGLRPHLVAPLYRVPRSRRCSTPWPARSTSAFRTRYRPATRCRPRRPRRLARRCLATASSRAPKDCRPSGR